MNSFACSELSELSVSSFLGSGTLISELVLGGARTGATLTAGTAAFAISLLETIGDSCGKIIY